MQRTIWNRQEGSVVPPEFSSTIPWRRREEYQIIIAEDDSAQAEELSRFIRSLGYSIPAIATTGEEAVRLSEQHQPDLILMEIELPGAISGITAAGMIQAIQKTPILFLTASPDTPVLPGINPARIAGYILRPYREREIQHSIESALYRCEIETRMQKNRIWFENILNSIGEGLIVVHPDGEIRFANPVARSMLSMAPSPAEDTLSLNQLVLYRPSDNTPVAITRNIEEPTPFSRFEFPLYLVDGEGKKRYVDGIVAPISGPERELLGSVISIRDITEKIIANKMITDALNQIEISMERFALLNDQIRNPLAVIVAMLDLYNPGILNDLMPQIQEIDGIIDQLDEGYIRSEKVHSFLKRHHEIN